MKKQTIIFYIDDDHEDGEIFCHVIRSIDPTIKCIILQDSQDAHRLFSDACPDFVFVDFLFPMGKTGSDILKEIGTHPCITAAKIVMFSHAMSENQLQECRRLGAHYCLEKSGDIEMMVSEIKRVIFD